MSTALVTVDLSQRPSAVRRMLLDGGIHHLPVLDQGRLVGLISSSDMYRLSMASYGADQRAVDAFLDHQFTLEDIMKTALVTIRPDAPIREAAEKLAHGRFHSLPVVDEHGALVGIVTSTDLVRCLMDEG